MDQLHSLAQNCNLSAILNLLNTNINDPLLYNTLDSIDKLSSFRDLFSIPVLKNNPSIYLASNSLGLQPKILSRLVNEELQAWNKQAVLAHFDHSKGSDYNWLNKEDLLVERFAKIINANKKEISFMGSLSSNLHTLVEAFYTPSQTKKKIVMETKPFPSDYYVIESVLKLKGLGKDTITEFDLSHNNLHKFKDFINKEGNSIQMVLVGVVNYLNGEFYNIPEIVEICRPYNIVVGLDLAHCVGNCSINMKEWNVHFAVWCTYKYMCCGPGNIGGLYVNLKYVDNSFARASGWWSHKQQTRFVMDNQMELEPGAYGFRFSNPSILGLCCVDAYLSTMEKVDMKTFYAKQALTTKYLETLILSDKTTSKLTTIITPSETNRRGCMICLLIESKVDAQALVQELEKDGIIVDIRKPNVIRIALYPLVNTYNEIYLFYVALKKRLQLMTQ